VIAKFDAGKSVDKGLAHPIPT